MRAFFLLLVLFTETIIASPPDGAEQKLVAPARDADDSFGISVGLGGDNLAVGTPGDDTGGVDLGCVHIYSRIEGPFEFSTTLYPNDGEPGDGFGQAISISDDGKTLVIGSPGVEGAAFDNVGAAYVFYWDESSWSRVARVVADSRTAEAAFGSAVVMNPSGSDCVVASPRHSESFERGAVWWFTRDFGGDDQWGRATVRFGEFADDLFGTALAYDGNYVAVSAPGYGEHGTVYMYQRTVETTNDWAQIRQINGTEEVDGWGAQLALATDLLLIGSDDRTVTLYARNAPSTDEWGIVQILSSTPLGWGRAVSAFEGVALIAAPEAPRLEWYQLVDESNPLSFVTDFVGSNAVFSDEFGISSDVAVGVDGSSFSLVIGSPGAQAGRGDVYVWEAKSPASSLAAPSLVSFAVMASFALFAVMAV